MSFLERCGAKRAKVEQRQDGQDTAHRKLVAPDTERTGRRADPGLGRTAAGVNLVLPIRYIYLATLSHTLGCSQNGAAVAFGGGFGNMERAWSAGVPAGEAYR